MTEKTYEQSNNLRDHLTCRGGGYGFLFRSEMFFRTTQELEYLFFLQNLTLGYMTKTLNHIIFFPPPKSEYFFHQHWESEWSVPNQTQITGYFPSMFL